MSVGYFRAYSNRVREASRELDERELRVYVALLSYANCEGMCWPGIRTIVEATGLHTEAVYDALQGLVGRGYVDIVREGTRDPLTHSMLPNVYRIAGAVIDDDCADDEYRTDDPILTSRENLESQHHQRTDSITQPESTLPKTPPPTRPIFSEVEEGKPKNNGKNTKQKPPTRSVIPNSPPPVPPNPSQFYRGPMQQWAEPLPDGKEAIAIAIYDALERKMTMRTARYLIATYGESRMDWAINHWRKQSDVVNPVGYIRALVERAAVEEVDGRPIDPGLAYITGPYADYINH